MLYTILKSRKKQNYDSRKKRYVFTSDFWQDLTYCYKKRYQIDLSIVIILRQKALSLEHNLLYSSSIYINLALTLIFMICLTHFRCRKLFKSSIKPQTLSYSTSLSKQFVKAISSKSITSKSMEDVRFIFQDEIEHKSGAVHFLTDLSRQTLNSRANN